MLLNWCLYNLKTFLFKVIEKQKFEELYNQYLLYKNLL